MKSVHTLLNKSCKGRNKSILPISFLAIITISCTSVLAESFGESRVAKWKNGAAAALSLTFDDNGLSRNASASILEEYGVRGTFYYITGQLYGNEQFPEISERGHEIGSHSVSHIYLTNLTAEELWFELSESKYFIEELTGNPCISFCYPYGALNSSIKQAVQELYVSARGTRQFFYGGINDFENTDLYDLTIGNQGRLGSEYTNEEYVSRMIEDVMAVSDVNGWNIELFHDVSIPDNGLEANAGVNESVLRSYLEYITSDTALWIAPVGTVARYLVERNTTFVETHLVTQNVIFIGLAFDGDKTVFNEPLTILTRISSDWLDGELTVMQGDKLLTYIITENADDVYLQYNALPDDDMVSIMFERDTLPGDLNGDGIVNLLDLAEMAAHWQECNARD